ncbi:MAG: TolC family protein [Bacillota bacterium]
MKLRRYTSVVLVAVLSALLAAGAGAADGEQRVAFLTIDSAVRLALSEGGRAEGARLRLTESLLQAANMEHEHEVGPPRSRSMTLPAGEGEGESVSITIFQPDKLDVARIEELLPLQFEAARDVALVTYIQEMAGARAAAINAYYTALLARGRMEVLEQSLLRVEAHHRRAEALYENGKVSEVDVFRSQVARAETRAQLRSTEGEFEAALVNLKEEIGLALDTPVVLEHTPEFTPVGELNLEQDLQRALEVNPGAAAARGNLVIAEKDMELFIETRGGFAGRRTYHECSLAVDSAMHELKQVERHLEAQVRNIHSRMPEIAGQIEARREQLELARRLEQIAGLRYEAGLGTVVDLLDASVAVREAEAAHLEAVVLHKMAAVEREVLLAEGVTDARDEFEQVLSEINELR